VGEPGASHPFRPRAWERYREGRDRAVLPRFSRPPVGRVFWPLLIVLAAATALAWHVRLPAYASGAVVRVDPGGDGAQPALVALVPAEILPRLRPGVALTLHLVGGASARRSIREVEAQLQSPAAVGHRFALDAETAGAVTGPVVVAILDDDPPHADLSQPDHPGTVYRVEVEVGSCRALALAPVLSRLFERCGRGASVPNVDLNG
jgi:hypothetical protein